MFNSDLNYHGEFTGDIDTLNTANSCGGYWIRSGSGASGALAFSVSHYLLIPVEFGGKLQVAVSYANGETKYRTYTNGKWQSWSSDKADSDHTHSNYYSSDKSRTANTFLAAPNGSDGSGSFRKITTSDLPLTGAIASVLTNKLTASRAVISNSNGNLTSSSVTSTELSYLSGVTSKVQEQLDAKQNASSFEWHGTTTADIDTLRGSDNCGGYWIKATDSSGTQPWTSGYYHLSVPVELNGRVQYAQNYSTGQMKSRCYVNDAWQQWTTTLPTWKQIGNTVSGTTSISFANYIDDYSELLAIVSYTDGGARSSITLPFNTGSFFAPLPSWYISASDHFVPTLYFNGGKVQISIVRMNGVDVTSSSSLSLYVR